MIFFVAEVADNLCGFILSHLRETALACCDESLFDSFARACAAISRIRFVKQLQVEF